MNIVFLMDPLESISYETDTTFALMMAAHRRRHRTFFCPKGGLALLDGRVRFQVEEVVAQPIKEQMFVRREHVTLQDDDVDAVFIRYDPPFNEEYLLQTWVLDFLPAHVKVVNTPAGLRSANEKIWALKFPSFVPPTVIGRNKNLLLDFLKKHHRIILKPINGHGGEDVFYVQEGDGNINVIFESMTFHQTRDIVIQKYIPEAIGGDKRILLLNGEPLGSVLRVHPLDDHRNNLSVGGIPHKTDITSRDQEIIGAIKPALLAEGLFFVGIDIIGDYLIEVNVTSPTGIQEMNRLYQTNFEDKVIEFIEK